MNAAIHECILFQYRLPETVIIQRNNINLISFGYVLVKNKRIANFHMIVEDGQ